MQSFESKSPSLYSLLLDHYAVTYVAFNRDKRTFTFSLCYYLQKFLSLYVTDVKKYARSITDFTLFCYQVLAL